MDELIALLEPGRLEKLEALCEERGTEPWILMSLLVHSLTEPDPGMDYVAAAHVWLNAVQCYF